MIYRFVFHQKKKETVMTAKNIHVSVIVELAWKLHHTQFLRKMKKMPVNFIMHVQTISLEIAVTFLYGRKILIITKPESVNVASLLRLLMWIETIHTWFHPIDLFVSITVIVTQKVASFMKIYKVRNFVFHIVTVLHSAK